MTGDWREEAWRHHNALGDEVRAAVDEYLTTLPPAGIAQFHFIAAIQSDLLIHGEAVIEPPDSCWQCNGRGTFTRDRCCGPCREEDIPCDECGGTGRATE